MSSREVSYGSRNYPGPIADQAVEAITIEDGCDGLRLGNVLLKSDETESSLSIRGKLPWRPVDA
jgi:hypothetical protein